MAETNGLWQKINVAVEAIDGMSHEIYRPQTKPQEQYVQDTDTSIQSKHFMQSFVNTEAGICLFGNGPLAAKTTPKGLFSCSIPSPQVST